MSGPRRDRATAGLGAAAPARSLRLVGVAQNGPMAATAPIDPTIPPSGTGCVECLASDDGWWYHLRRCAHCGHVGCCDTSPSQHARRHAADALHPIVQSFEPGEDWFYDFASDQF